MNIRRSVAGLLTVLALVSGGALTACGDPDSTTGTPKDTATNTSGADPGGVSQGNLPDNDNSKTSGNESRNEDSGNG
jgi:ABC-type oligopeptide transport system substrate-binding subunit